MRKLFKNGRWFAAWLGLVPRQYSTGGKPSLGRITKLRWRFTCDDDVAFVVGGDQDNDAERAGHGAARHRVQALRVQRVRILLDQSLASRSAARLAPVGAPTPSELLVGFV